MRKILNALTVVAATVFICCAVFTQVSAQPSFELGVKAGLGLAKLTGDDTKSTESGVIDLGGGWYAEGTISEAYDETKLGFVGGAYATVRVNPTFGFRFEALYTKKGGEGKNSGSLDVYDEFDAYQGTVNISGTNTVTLDYLEFPLLAVVSFPVSPTGSFDIFAGPALGFKTNAEVETEVIFSANGSSDSESEKIDISDDIEGTDFGGVIGAGISFKLQTVVLFGEARYTYGFTKIDKVEDNDIKNSAFGFMVGVGIPLAQVK